MAKLKALDEFLDTTLTLPVGGKEYTVPAPSAETGLLCQKLMHAGVAAANGKETDLADLDDVEEFNLYKRCLGPVHEELLADKISWPVIKLCGVTAFLWIAADLDTATRYWESGGNPEAPAPDQTTSSAAASSTWSRGSTSGTNPRRKAAPSRGKAS
ncbi:DUF7426 family protein [Streptosporangium sp. CA-135522]|uniref:DUF7426 family protein n=1 Tax=Streptosporangium sp. CA-135522 TaxID=3240072 RepID=UPI003D93C56C